MIDNTIIDIIRHLLNEIKVEITSEQKEQLKKMGVDWKTKCTQVKLLQLAHRLAEILNMKLVPKDYTKGLYI